MYAQALKDIYTEDYYNGLKRLEIIKGNNAFLALLKKYSFPTCESLQIYIEARKAEYEKRYEEASELYSQIDVFDSLDRVFLVGNIITELKYKEAISLFETGQYTEAAVLFSSLGDYLDSIEMAHKAADLIPVPTPTPTPQLLFNNNKESLIHMCTPPMEKLPALPNTSSNNGVIGITHCYVSEADQDKVMYIKGYGYVQEKSFDGSLAKSWLIITEVASDQSICYPLTMSPNASGITHDGATCKNASSCDFELYFEVSQYNEGIYSIALVIGYKDSIMNTNNFRYYQFDNDKKFTVLKGRIITPIACE